MEKNEFKANRDTISDKIESSKAYTESLNSQITLLSQHIIDYLNDIKQRDSSLLSYIDMLSDFNYSDKLTSPLEMFPGIRTAAQMSDPEELKARSDKMKDTAFTVKRTADNVDSMGAVISRELKNIFATIGEQKAMEDSIYDLSMDLLDKSNSIYDVGGFSH